MKVDVLRLSRGKRLIKRRKVARVRAAAGDDGARVGGRRLRAPGVFVARFRTRGVFGETDTRRLAFRRTRAGKLRRLAKFEANSGCGLMRSFRLTAPVFGRSGVKARFDLAPEATSYVLRRGKRVLGRGNPRGATFRIVAKRRGRVRLTLVVRGQGRKVTQKLVARRL